MSADVQQINLYRPEEAGNTISQSSRLLLLSSVVILVAVVALAAAGEFYLGGLRDDRDAVADQLGQAKVRISAMDESLATPGIDPFLEAELSRLGDTRRFLQANLAAVKQGTRSQRQFSAVFGSLARNTLDGLWLNEVGVAAGGSEMWLRGQTVEPALVPRLLQTLSVEPAFNGRTFRKVSFERQDTDNGALVDFELRSATVSEDADAG